MRAIFALQQCLLVVIVFCNRFDGVVRCFRFNRCFKQFFNRQLDAAAVIDIHTFNIDFLTFLQVIADVFNTLVSDLTTVICLDDYHLNDREGRKVTKRTALDPEENNFDLMYEQVQALKKGETVQKPIYNHVNGTLDTPETIGRDRHLRLSMNDIAEPRDGLVVPSEDHVAQLIQSSQL